MPSPSDSAPRPRRVLSAWFPAFSTDRVRRLSGREAEAARPVAASSPLVTVRREAGSLRLAGVDRAAAALGLAPGITLADARAVHPALDVVEADEAAEARLLAEVGAWCGRWTPLVALDPPDALLLDVTGCAHLVGGEAALLGEVRARLRAQGLDARLGLAGTARAARALARFADGTIAPPGEEEALVSPLPVAALGLGPLVARALARAGLKRVGDVAGRSRAPLAARFGPGLTKAIEEVMGRADEPMIPLRPRPAHRAERRLLEPVVTEGAVMRVLADLAADLGAGLERAGEGARRLEATFYRVDGGVRRVVVEAGRPLREPRAVLRLFRERLGALSDPLDPGYGYEVLRLEAPLVEPLVPVVIGLGPNPGEEEAVLALVDRMSARFGAERVLRFAPRDGHLPEHAARALPAQRLAGRVLPPWSPARGAGEPPSRPLRLFREPLPVEVRGDLEGWDGEDAPARFVWRRALRVTARAEGPERIAPPWWRSDAVPPPRDYWRVEDREGRRYWMFRQGGEEDEPPAAGSLVAAARAPLWFVHGLFA